MVGIYKITNLINNKVYIGQSKEIEKRWRIHKTRAFNGDAKTNKEYNKILYRAFRKYGLDNFKFEVIEECSIEQLDNLEHYYIMKYSANNDKYGYNETSGYDSLQYGISGEQHPNHILTEKDVYYIRECYNQKCEKETIYELFKDKVSQSGFNKIWNNCTWKNVHQDVYTEENAQYYKFKRNSHSGSTNPKAKLTEDIVRAIRLRKKSGEKRTEVYKDYMVYGITEASFKQVWFSQNWKYIVV